MKRKNILLAAVLAVVLAAALAFAGCGSTTPVVTGIYATDNGYIVYYSDGTMSTLAGGGSEITIDELYERYKEEYGDISYEEFLQKYLTVDVGADNASVINGLLRSSVVVYSEFTVSEQGWFGQVNRGISVSTGSGVIYRIDDDYTYIITNYHVVYNADANADNGDSNIARALHCYLYGSEGTPTATNRYDSQGYPIYSYGSNALECEYVGGSATADLVLLRVKTEELRRINAGAVAVQFAEDYRVGETAIVIGNAEDLGTSVTEGIVSVDREKVRLSDVDGVTRTYQLMRVDAAAYGGNSGGGVFDAEGKLIGILNSGSREAQNINFAIPVETVAGVTENIYYYATDGDDSTEGVYKVTLGVTVQYDNSRYEYDASTGYGSIRETITVQGVTGGSLADEMGLQSGDVLQSVTIDGKTYSIDRQYDLDDALYRLQPGESCSLTYLRDGKVCESSTVLAEAGDCSAID